MGGDMSSTRVRERRGSHLDFYRTPRRVVEGLLSHKFLDEGVKNLLEPSAGDGAIIEVVREKLPFIKVTAVEIQPRFSTDLAKFNCDATITDFLSMPAMPMYDRIIANPPFSQAEEFIRHCWNFLHPKGQMAFLLRLPFLAGVKRYKLFKEIRPTDIYVLSQRPKFGGNNIDSCDYAWVVWERDPCLKITRLNWITPSDN